MGGLVGQPIVDPLPIGSDQSRVTMSVQPIKCLSSCGRVPFLKCLCDLLDPSEFGSTRGGVDPAISQELVLDIIIRCM